MGSAGGESERLDRIAADSWYARGPNRQMVEYSAEVFARFWRGPSCLELGPAEGVMTDALAAAFADLTLVEGSEAFCRDLAARYPAATVVHSLFEEFESGRRFDTILLGHVLEHVEDPVAILRRARSWLAPDGVLLASVPNARSVHRQAAVEMGLLERVNALNETDVHQGHRRVYDPEALAADARAAGLRVRFQGGYWLKPVSNAQIESSWTPDMLAAFMRLGERYPDIAAETYIVADAG